MLKSFACGLVCLVTWPLTPVCSSQLWISRLVLAPPPSWRVCTSWLLLRVPVTSWLLLVPLDRVSSSRFLRALLFWSWHFLVPHCSYWIVWAPPDSSRLFLAALSASWFLLALVFSWLLLALPCFSWCLGSPGSSWGFLLFLVLSGSSWLLLAPFASPWIVLAAGGSSRLFLAAPGAALLIRPLLAPLVLSGCL